MLISYNEVVLGAARKTLLFLALLTVSFAGGLAFGVSMWEGEPTTDGNPKRKVASRLSVLHSEGVFGERWVALYSRAAEKTSLLGSSRENDYLAKVR